MEEKGAGKQRIKEHNLKDELTLMVSEKRRAPCICTSSRVLLIPLPTASTIAANGTNSSVALSLSSWFLFDHKARCSRYRSMKREQRIFQRALKEMNSEDDVEFKVAVVGEQGRHVMSTTDYKLINRSCGNAPEVATAASPL
jgi:hypothetical protein